MLLVPRHLIQVVQAVLDAGFPQHAVPEIEIKDDRTASQSQIQPGGVTDGDIIAVAS